MEVGDSKRLLYVGETDNYEFVDSHGNTTRVAKDKLIGVSVLIENAYCILKRQTYGCYVASR